MKVLGGIPRRLSLPGVALLLSPAVAPSRSVEPTAELEALSTASTRWRDLTTDTSKTVDAQAIHARLHALHEANRKKDVHAIRSALGSMDVRHLRESPAETTQDVLRQLLYSSSLLADPDVALATIALLQECTAPILADQYAHVLRALVRCTPHRLPEALDFLRHQVPREELNISLVNLVMLRAANQGSPDVLAQSISLIEKSGLQKDSDSYVALLTAEAASNRVDRGVAGLRQLWEEMATIESRSALPLITYTSHCVRVCSLCSLAQREPRVLHDAVEAYTEFLQWDHSREEQGFALSGDRVARNRLLKATNKALRTAQELHATQTFHDIMELCMNARIKLDMRIYNQVLSHGVRKGASPAAISSMIDDISKSKRQPNQHTIKALVRAHAQAGNVQAALAQLETMGQGQSTDCSDYDPLLRALASRGMYKDSDMVYKIMRARHIKPDVYTFDALFRSLACAARVEPLPTKSLRNRDERHWHRQTVNDYRRRVRASALPLLEEWAMHMQRLEVAHTACTIESFLQALGNLGEWKTMLFELRRAQAGGLKLREQAFNHAIYILAKNSNRKAANLLRLEMDGAGLKVTATTYACLLAGCEILPDGLDEAERLFAEMKAAGVVPHMMLYNKLIEVHLMHEDVAGAKALLADLEKHGFEPNYHTWWQFSKGAAKLGDQDLLRWAVPRAASTARDPAKYHPPAEFFELPRVQPSSSQEAEAPEY